LLACILDLSLLVAIDRHALENNCIESDMPGPLRVTTLESLVTQDPPVFFFRIHVSEDSHLFSPFSHGPALGPRKI
jgi:hypothetical protein